MKRFAFILLGLVLTISQSIYSQTQYIPFPTPCLFDSVPALTLTYPYNKSNDPLITMNGLPLNIALTYATLNWACTNYNDSTVANILDNMTTFNDTLRYFGKYLYELTDYDPMMMALFSRRGRFPIWTLHPRTTSNKILDKYCSLSSNPNLDRMLLYSDYISLITVTDTMRIYDTSMVRVKNGITVTCEINDEIKGSNRPQCYNLYNSTIKPGKKGSSLTQETTTNANCFQFDYKLELPLQMPPGGAVFCEICAVDSLGQPYVKKGKQYLGIFQVYLLCSDSTSNSYVISPLKTGQQPYLLPVENGMIYDAINEFGLGITNTVQEFVAKLRTRIDYIKMN